MIEEVIEHKELESVAEPATAGTNTGTEARPELPEARPVRRESGPVKLRPREPEETTEPPQPKLFPKVTKFKVDPPDGFKYWKALPDECLYRCQVYVYRQWPILNHLQALSPEEQEQVRLKQKPLITNIDKPSDPFDPQDWVMELLRRYGSGDYLFILNDVGVKGNKLFPPKGIIRWECRGSQYAGLRNKDYPPILDVEVLDQADPANRSYIQDLRLKGTRLPGDTGYSTQEEGEEMAGTAVVEKFAEIANDATKRAAMAEAKLELKEKEASKETTDNKDKKQSQVDAGSKAVEVLGAASVKATEILTQAIQTAQANQAKAQDPVEFHKAVMEAAGKAGGGGGGSEMAMAMMNKMMEMQQKSFELVIHQMEERLKLAESLLKDRANPAPAAAAITPAGAPVVATDPRAPRTFLQQINEVVAAKEALGNLFGLGDSTPDMPGWVPYALKGLGMVVQGVSTWSHNMAVLKTGQGQPISAQIDTSMPGEEGGEVETEEEIQSQSQQQGQQSLPGQVQQPQQQQQPQPRQTQGGGDKDVNAAQRFLERLNTPLVMALAREMPGHEFAAQLALTEGQMAYEYLVGMGKDRVLMMLKQYQPLWQAVMTKPMYFDKFLDDFLNVDKVNEVLPAVQAAILKAQQAAAQPKRTGGRTVIDGRGRKVETMPPPAAAPAPDSLQPAVEAEIIHRPPIVS